MTLHWELLSVTVHITHYTLHITRYALHITHYTLNITLREVLQQQGVVSSLDRSALGNRFTPDDTNRSRACRTEGRRAIH